MRSCFPKQRQRVPKEPHPTCLLPSTGIHTHTCTCTHICNCIHMCTPHINIMHTYPSEDSPKTSPLFELVYQFQVLSLCLMPKPWPQCDVLLWPTLPYWVFAACNILLKEVGRHLGRFRGAFYTTGPYSKLTAFLNLKAKCQVLRISVGPWPRSIFYSAKCPGPRCSVSNMPREPANYCDHPKHPSHKSRHFAVGFMTPGLLTKPGRASALFEPLPVFPGLPCRCPTAPQLSFRCLLGKSFPFIRQPYC